MDFWLRTIVDSFLDPLLHVVERVLFNLEAVLDEPLFVLLVP